MKKGSPKKTKATARKAVVVEKKVASSRKKKAPAPRKAKKKQAAARPRKRAKITSKRAAKKKKRTPDAPASRPSQRALAIVAQLPAERPLTDEEREAMAKVAHTALATLDTDGVPERIVACIATYVDEIRGGLRPEPSSQDVRLGLGVLWGEQVRAQVGWRWVHLSYPNGFASYALVPDDRAFACFPLNRLVELMKAGAERANTSVPLFDSIRVGTLPARRENAYLVIG